MRVVLFLFLTLTLFNRVNAQSVVLSTSELNLVDKLTKGMSQAKIKYFVVIDKYDCFNCTLSSSLIKEEIDSNQVFVLIDGVSDSQLPDYIRNYGLSLSFNYIRNPKLLSLLIKTSREFTTDRSLILEQNSIFITPLSLRNFKNKKSFSQVSFSQNKSLSHTGHFVSAITKHLPFKKGTICFTSPKSEVYYLLNDSFVSSIQIDSIKLELAFNYVLSQQPVSARSVNNYDKCMGTYKQQLSKLGFSLLTPQNIINSGDKLVAIVQISFPIWTSATAVDFTGEFFYCELDVDVDNHLKVVNVFPIHNEDLPRGKMIFAHNYFSQKGDGVIVLGYYLDSMAVHDQSLNVMHSSYKLASDNIFYRAKEGLHNPPAIVEKYSSSKNIALIHRQIGPDFYQYSYSPLIVSEKSIIELFDYSFESLSYHSYCSVLKKGLFTDFCSVNGIYYLVTYDVNKDYDVQEIKRLDFEGRIRSAFMMNESIDYIVLKEGLFYRSTFEL